MSTGTRSRFSLVLVLGPALILAGQAPRASDAGAPSERTRCLPADFGAPRRHSTEGMVRVPAGSFTPGSHRSYPEERPARSVQVDAFWIDRTEVTNAQFAAFVAATGYRTVAERRGLSSVFVVPTGADRDRENAWWRPTAGASWRHPEGPGSHSVGKPHHPVVHIALEDALAYARWLGRDLPTEAEWEWAAGRLGADPDGEPRGPRGPLANYWQGPFPEGNSGEDGFRGPAPVGCFPPSSRGLHDMIGNVWEWTRDPYATWEERAAPDGHCHPPITGGGLAVLKGGSYLCAPSHCVRFRAAARHPQEADVTTSHIGFRTVLRVR
jgi:formylglycine-generating enzyme